MEHVNMRSTACWKLYLHLENTTHKHVVAFALEHLVDAMGVVVWQSLIIVVVLDTYDYTMNTHEHPQPQMLLSSCM